MDLMPEQGTRPVNKYLPPRARDALAPARPPAAGDPSTEGLPGFLGWVDRTLARF
jgi:hypothetical protein